MTPLDGLVRSGPDDVNDVISFLRAVDLTLTGLDDPALRLWIRRDEHGAIDATTGLELEGENALIRSVAVSPGTRGQGLGLALARFSMERAAESGAEHAWLFSRRSGPFWQRLGFTLTDRSELVRVLSTTHQVRAFADSGQLEREVAWTRPLQRGDPRARAESSSAL